MDDVDALLGSRVAAEPGVETRVMRAKLEARLFDRVANPVRIGGFEIVQQIGEGGMGTVWLAHDPRLDRRVAVKLLHAASEGVRGSDLLLREARALARLAHPHVVTVFESGMFEDDVFVAMEYLDGGSLAEWIAAHPVATRSHALATIDRFISAGRGLAAAHDAGLVHRDFKPTNVLLGADGRLKVADFGLARALPARAASDGATDPDATARPRPTEESALERAAIDSTAAGGGTPAYMAPEQFDGRADARSDQFSFCVALWEALHGVRPFAGASFTMRERDPSSVPLPPRTARSPSWAVQALRRGLAFDPRDRWPSMHALVAALDAAPRTARRRRLGAVAGGAAIVALIAWRPWHVEATPCERTGEELANAWDDNVRATVEQAFAAVGSSLAAETWPRVDPLLSDYAERWLAVRDAACEASMVRHERSTAAFHATMACLERRRDALEATTSVLGSADAAAVARAVEALQSLAPPEDCDDPTAHGERELVDEPELRATIAELQRAIDEGHASLRLGRLANVRATIAAIAPRVETLGRPELLAQLRFLQSQIAIEEFDGETSETRALEALREAARAGDDRLTAVLWRHLVWAIAVVRGEPRRALSLELAAATAVLRAGDDPQHRADLLQAIGSAHAEAAQLDEAEASLGEAMALVRAHDGAESPDLATTLGSLAMVRDRLGRYDEALAMHREALRILELSLGAHHPRSALERARLGASLSHLGRYAEAIEPLERAIADLEATHGSDHDEIAWALAVLGPALASVDRLDTGIAAVERAVAICERLGNDGRSTYDYALSNLGTLLDWAGRTEDALAVSEKAIAAIERAPEPDRSLLAANLSNQAVLRAKSGQLAAAREGFERSIALTEALLGPEHPSLAHPLMMLAEIATLERRTADALALAERAAPLSKVGSWPPDVAANMQFQRVRARWDAGVRDAETQQLLAAAEDLAREAEQHELVEQIVAWRAAHRSGL